ncbi:B-cell receptor CD22-like isoform X1 [Takifugu flavidus]|uniref:B-cell receptor CD22-like isoform X1 n=1 Tax=Takifugu flavidus TaxID=433684 RepID=UPI0025442342|nr:B-cell receptor CD22-like isoform X1 [Takifugu flavidus]
MELCRYSRILSMRSHFLIILATISGARRGSLEVTLDSDLCVLRGASAVINCRYSKPFSHAVTEVDWWKHKQVVGYWRRGSLPNFRDSSQRYRYLGDFISDCRLQINDVQHADAGNYFFSFYARSEEKSKTSTKLYVKELTAAVQPSSVAEGDDIRLTCVSGCPTPVDAVWFKDGQPVSNVFVARREDTGRYHCAVRGQERVRSAPVAVNVLYPPDRVTLTISSPGNVVRGSSVVLTCHSDASPPVRNNGYSLYREGRFIGSGQTYTIPDVQPDHSGRYHCQAWNNISSRGVDHFNSSAVLLQVYYVPENISITINPAHVVWGSSVTLTCSSDANPPVRNNGYSLYREGRFIGLGQNYTIPDVQPDHSGRYHCQAWNNISSRGVDHFNSSAVLLQVYCTYLDINSTQHISDDDDVTVWDPVLLPDVPENITITINPAHVVWGSSVNLTCSSDANPPADTYIWYRNTNSNGSQVGSGQVLSIPSMEALHSGLYLCQARNQVGGKNSTEVLLAMVDEEQRGSQMLPAVVGIGLALIVALVVALFLFCRWKKRRLHQKALDESNVIYSNIQRPDSALPDVARHTIRSSSSSQSPASIGGEVIYSLVNIKSRDLEGLSDSPDVQGSRSKGKNSIDSVIYATISPR